MRIGEVCKRNVVTTVARASLADVARLMRANHVGSVIVIDPPGSRIPVGIVTDRDIVVEAVAGGLDARTLSAGEIMTRNPVTASESDDASWSLKVMRDRGIRRLPVVDTAGELTGIVALDDLLESASVALSDVVQAIGTEKVVEGQRRKAPA
jgi:CBS domain-containing protein